MDLIVPPIEDIDYPTLGDQVCDFLEGKTEAWQQDWRGACFGPGDLKGQPLKLDDDRRFIIYRAYEVWPADHPKAGRRRWKRIAVSVRKGFAKTELMALIAYAELHPFSPVRFNGFDDDRPCGLALGRPVVDPYIPMLANAKLQVEELAYGALKFICEEGPDADLFDVSLDRVIRLDERGRADGKAVPLANSPDSNDGGRTTFNAFDEPLAIDTEVPTTDGWSTIGALMAGDFVYDRWGKPVRVLGTSPVQVGRECYRVSFSDGASVVTDANHRWKALDWANKPRGEQVITTVQMLQRGLDTGYGKRWRLPRSNGFDGVPADLPIDPYLAGMWLGDGATNAGYIHSHVDDFKEVCGDIPHTVAAPVKGRESVVRWLPKGLRSKLRSAGMLGCKHIPDSYKFASREQRLHLMAGLVDSDGYVIPGTGSVTFVQGKEHLARDVHELALSLGWSSSLSQRPDSRSRTGLMWKVQFYAADGIPCRLARKHVACKANVNHRWPTIVSIVPTGSVPVRCIKVDNDDCLFVFGRECRLTHNTHRLYLESERAAVTTMEANLGKRVAQDPWSMSTTTAGAPGQNSVAETDHFEAEAMQRGEIKRPRMFYFHRQASDDWDMEVFEDRVEAIREASGPELAARTDLEDLASQWDLPSADKPYLERVWTNRWTQQGASAFDIKQFKTLARPHLSIPRRAFVTVGFDGARFRDSTAMVMTDVRTGLQQIEFLAEKPLLDDEWEVSEAAVTAKWNFIRRNYRVMLMYADPPFWNSTVSEWSTKAGESLLTKKPIVQEFWTNKQDRMIKALLAYQDAIDSSKVIFADQKDGQPAQHGDLVRHVGNAGKLLLNRVDLETGKPLWLLTKIHKDRKFDACMAAVLSWQARMEVKKFLPAKRGRVVRVR